jgi:anti-sigma factor RsiW
MSGADDARNAKFAGGIHKSDLPPIPRAGESGREVCAIVRLYLAIIDDLTPQQVAQIAEHVATCAACAEEFKLMERATHLVGSLTDSAPSPRVDAALFALMQRNREAQQGTSHTISRRTRRTPKQRRVRWIVGQLVAAAVIILALITTAHFAGIFGPASGSQTAFALPSTLSWSQYVLYHTETRTATNGALYQVESYHDLATGDMHVETKMDSQIDVVMVGNSQETLGMDTIHHVAQMGADQWSVDDSIFDLNGLRHEMQTHEATYLGIDTFKGQSVYRIRYQNGLVILLSVQYMPVNVLRGAAGPGTGYPIYTDLKMLLASQVPDSMWTMSVPPGFRMGTLPPQP